MMSLLYRHRGSDNPRHDPPLALAQRPALDDRDAIAHLGGVVLVMRDELRRPALGLAIEAVPHLPLDGNDAGLLHLVADDDAFFFGLLCHWFIFSNLPRGPTLTACAFAAFRRLGDGCNTCLLSAATCPFRSSFFPT